MSRDTFGQKQKTRASSLNSAYLNKITISHIQDQSPSPYHQCCLQVSDKVSWHKLRCWHSANMLQHWVGRRVLIYFCKANHCRISINFSRNRLCLNNLCEILQLLNFTLNSKFWVFELTFLQKSISTRKQKKLSSPLNSECFNYSAYHTPVSKNNFQFWDQIRPKRVFCDGSKKIAHHHWVLHILTSLQSWTKYLEQNREVQ